jgi:putative peptidoglycan lipid II flippase
VKAFRTSAQIALIMAVLTLVSKVFGFVREMIMANYYGTSYVADTLNIASGIPNMIFAGILSATATSFIPVFSKTMEGEGERAANLFTSRLLNMLILVSVVSSFVGILFSRQLVTIFTMADAEAFPASADTMIEKLQWILTHLSWYLTHGWTGEKAALAAFYVKVTFSFCLFSTAGGVLESYLKYKNVFIAPILAGYLINLAAIVFILFGVRTEDPRLLVFGVFAGNVLRTVILCVLARRKQFRYTFDLRMNAAVRQIFTLAVPVFLGSTAGSINLFVNKSLASGLPTGSVAALGYAELLITLISGLTATIIGTILYPKMAQAYSLANKPRFTELFTSGLTVIIIIGAPFTLGAMLYSETVVQIVYERGAFDLASTGLTSTAFFCYAPGLIFSMMQGFLIQAFYSKHNTKTPLITAVIAVAVNVIANLVLINYLGHGGLALGWSLSAFSGALLLLAALRRQSPGLLNLALVKKAAAICLSAVIAVGAAYPLFFFVGTFFTDHNWVMPRMVLLGATVLLAAVIYLPLLKAFRIRELSHLRDMFKAP